MLRRVRPALAFSTVLAIGAIALTACSSQGTPSVLQGTGPLRSETRSVPAFTSIDVRHGIKLDLRIGSPAKVELEAAENLLPIARTDVSAGTLVVDATRDYSSPDGISVKVTTPSLTALALSGGAVGSATGVDVTGLAVRTDGGAVLTLTGRAESLDLSAKGGGRLDLRDFSAKAATVDLAGGVAVTIAVSDSVKGRAVGSAALVVRGHPSRIDVSTTGGAVVTQE
jgi:hypothetical protein